jgi:hypothetical protein
MIAVGANGVTCGSNHHLKVVSHLGVCVERSRVTFLSDYRLTHNDLLMAAFGLVWGACQVSVTGIAGCSATLWHILLPVQGGHWPTDFANMVMQFDDQMAGSGSPTAAGV